MSVTSWRWLLCIALFMLGFIRSAAAEELALELGVEDFSWREYDGGARLLEESGLRYRLGANWARPLGEDPRNSMHVRGSLYFASVDYDGQACTLSGSCIPFQSDTDYLGVNGEVSFARRLGASENMEVFGGGGIDSWERDVRGKGSVSGATEDWWVLYLFAGAGGYWQSDGARYHAQAGVKLPFKTFEYADSYNVTLNPRGKASLFARLSTDIMAGGKPQWGFGIYYDSYRFSMSDVERSGSVLIWQPDSEQDVVGIYGTIYLN